MTNETSSTIPPPVSEERLRNQRAWAASRIGSLSGADITVSAIDELLSARTTIAALRKEVDGLLQLQQDGWQLVCESSLARVMKERDELRRDALRYRWLRLYACANEFNWMMDDVDDQLSVEDAARKLDDAIDAQLAITPSPLSVPHE